MLQAVALLGSSLHPENNRELFASPITRCGELIEPTG